MSRRRSPEKEFECLQVLGLCAITIPRAACSSLRAWLCSIKDRKQYHEIDQGFGIHRWYALHRTKKTESQLQRYYTMAMVRNPLARARSTYLSKIGNRNNPKFHRPGLSFTAWLQELDGDWDNRDEWNEHWRPQYNMVPETLSRLCRFESFTGDMADVCRDLGLEAPRWENPDHKRTGRLEITGRDRELAAEIWAGDYARFGYRVENRP